MSKQASPDDEPVDGPGVQAYTGPEAEPVVFEPAEPSELEAELAAEKDRNLRLQAELQNVLSRKSREVADERKYGALPLMRDVLPVLDNVDRAIQAVEKKDGELTPEGKSLLEGFRLVKQQLVTTLAQHGCEVIPAEGEAFNPELHAAILQQPSDEHPAGVVTMQTQVGYQLAGRVVRPSQVIVSSGPAAG